MRVLVIACIAAMSAGCGSKLYRETPTATFTGALDVRWVENDYFLFLPNKNDPFVLTRPDGSRIFPGPMYTDGGSIPRFLWGVEGFSPWGYAPSYVIHDWLFEAHHCHYIPDDKYTFEDSVHVLAEGMKAVMEKSPEVRDYFVFDSVVAAVGSPIARELWESGVCKPPPIDHAKLLREGPPGKLIMTIQFK